MSLTVLKPEAEEQLASYGLAYVLEQGSLPIIARLFDCLPAQVRMILRICIYGITAGLAIVAFPLATNGLYRCGIVASASLRLPIFAEASLTITTVTSLITGLLLRFCPEATGSGAPQLKVAFLEI